MKDKLYFMALPEMVRMREGVNEDGYFRADRAFFVLSAFIWLASPPALTVEVTIKPVRILRNRCRAMV